MVYSAQLRQAVGCVRQTLALMGITVEDKRFTRHGEHQVSPDAPLVLVACSGGRDSMALAAVSQTVCTSLGVRCGAVLVDHQLQSGSGQVSAQAASRCSALGLEPVVIRTITVDSSGQGAEADARRARYQALVDVADDTKAVAVLLAHTKNDQAETILIDLLRSGGVDALAGMPARFDLAGVAFARPLLTLTRAQTTGICEDLHLDWWDDPTNAEHVPADVTLPSHYPLRTRIRHDLIPYLERFTGGDIVAHLTASPQSRFDRDFLDEQAGRLAARVVSTTAGDGPVQAVLDATGMEGEHPALRLRVIAHTLSGLGIAASSAQVAAIDHLVADWHGQGPVALPSGYSVFRQKHVIRVCQDSGHAHC